jgi:hypothetical protein
MHQIHLLSDPSDSAGGQQLLIGGGDPASKSCFSKVSRNIFQGEST